MRISEGVTVVGVSEGVASDSDSMGDPKTPLEYSLTVTTSRVVLEVSEVTFMVGYIISNSIKGLINKGFSLVGVGE